MLFSLNCISPLSVRRIFPPDNADISPFTRTPFKPFSLSGATLSGATAGHIFATDCKKGLPPRGLDFLKNVCDAVEIPVYAIGGINIAPSDDSTASDAPPAYDAMPDISVPRLADVMECGAAGGCIMSGMMRV